MSRFHHKTPPQPAQIQLARIRLVIVRGKENRDRHWYSCLLQHPVHGVFIPGLFCQGMHVDATAIPPIDFLHQWQEGQVCIAGPVQEDVHHQISLQYGLVNHSKVIRLHL